VVIDRCVRRVRRICWWLGRPLDRQHMNTNREIARATEIRRGSGSESSPILLVP
jgi:hypothetical protein